MKDIRVDCRKTVCKVNVPVGKDVIRECGNLARDHAIGILDSEAIVHIPEEENR